MAFLLVFTVLESAVNSDFDYSTTACFGIGLDVFLGRSLSLLIPIDGHSVYPTRSFGPAFVAWITGSRKGGHLSGHVDFRQPLGLFCLFVFVVHSLHHHTPVPWINVERQLFIEWVMPEHMFIEWALSAAGTLIMASLSSPPSSCLLPAPGTLPTWRWRWKTSLVSTG